MSDTAWMTPVWMTAAAESAEPERVRMRGAQLAASSAGEVLRQADAPTARILAGLFSGSQWAGELLGAHPEWLSDLTPDRLAHPRQASGVTREADGLLAPCLEQRDYTGGFAALRRFKQREMLRIAARDLGGLGKAPDIIRDLSNVADACLDGVFRLCWQQAVERFGQPWHPTPEGGWEQTECCVLGLGKLGGQELNYSSDVDVIFLYTAEGGVFREPPKSRAAKPGLTSHQFFIKLTEAVVAEVGRATADGQLYRIDLRLRPEGDAGPLARSLESCEHFYAQFGQTWERMMLLKGRGVAGSRSLAGEFLELIHTFRYPRSFNTRSLDEIRAMKERTEKEVIRSGELDRDVKRGRGGIREIEFVAQTLQLLHAGRYPFLQGAQTIPTLEKLVGYNLMPAEESAFLIEAYCFFRNVEHRLQMEANQQTHSIPAVPAARERLARLMGFAGWPEFEEARSLRAVKVRSVYEKLLKSDRPQVQSGLPGDFEETEGEWRQLLASRSFRDPDKAVKLLREFALGPGFGHVSTRTTELAYELIGRILEKCPVAVASPLLVAGPPLGPALAPAAAADGSGNSPAALATGATAAAVAAVAAPLLGPAPAPAASADGSGRGSAALAAGASEPLLGPALAPAAAADRAGRSSPALASSAAAAAAPLAGSASSTAAVLSDPDRVLARLDSFVAAYGARSTLYEMWAHNPSLFGLLLMLFDRSEFLAEKAIRTPDMVDDLMLSGHLRRRKNAPEILRELQHGRDDPDQALWTRRYHNTEFMRLGLRDILGLSDWEQNLKELSALADACLQFALESVLRKNRIRAAPFVIIGLGKLGGEEIDYGSDLDILFVAPARTRNLSKLQPLAAKVMEVLSAQTELGVVYPVDARLRPDGAKGLLVNTLDAYEEYYRRRAQLWEVQALTRVRPVAGDFTLGKEFEALAGTLSDFRQETVASGFRVDGMEPVRGAKGGRAAAARTGLSAYTPRWKQEIARMRGRIEKERTPAGKEALAIKTGAGGMVDGEFVAQALCLANGWQEPNTLRVLERARETGALPEADAVALLANYREMRRVEAILRRWSYEGEILLPDDPAPQYRVAVRCGWRSAAELLEATGRCRLAIREVYTRFFPPPTQP